MPTFYAGQTDYIEKLNELDTGVTGSAAAAAASAAAALVSENNSASSATAAANSAAAALDSENAAAAAANNKGEWSALTGALNVPASVNHNDKIWILNTNLADVTLSEPSDTNTDWTEYPYAETLPAISQATSSNTVVANFVYDTTKDHSPGWIDETQSGFKRVSGLELEATVLTIRDMSDASVSSYKTITTSGATCVAALNGFIYIGTSSGLKSYDIDFNYNEKDYSSDIINSAVNDIAVTQDSAGNNIVAVATDGNGTYSTSVILADSSVVDIADDTTGTEVSVDFDSDNRLIVVRSDGTVYIWNTIPTADGTSPDATFSASSTPALLGTASKVKAMVSGEIAITSSTGVTYLKYNSDTPANSSVAYQTADYNTGWLYSDIKGSFLNDTTVETVGVEIVEIATNHDFSNWTGDDPDNWTVANEDANNYVTEHASGARIVSNNTANLNITQVFSVTSGQEYNLVITKSNHTSGEIRISGSTITLQNISGSNANGTYNVPFIADASISSFTLYRDNIGNTDYVIDSISVKRSDNLVLNGTFESDTEWTKGTGWTIGSGVASSDGTQTADSLLTTATVPTTVTGENYVVSFEITAYTTGNVALQFDGLEVIADKAATGVYFASVTASDTTGTIDIVADLNFVGSVDNITLYPATPDNSVNANNLEIHGQLIKALVATGSDSVAWSGFSTDNFLQQRYNSALDFGTGNFFVMGWANPNTYAGVTDWILSRYGSTVSFELGCDSASIYFNCGATQVSGTPLTANIWSFIVFFRIGTSIYLYVNNVLIDSDTSSDNVSDSTAVTMIGNQVSDLTRSFNGSLSRIRIGGISGSPTLAELTEVIEGFYNDEKYLYQDDSLSTLQGASNNIQTMDYNDTKDLLTVCSSDYLSRTQGLRVVDSESTATAIDTISTNGIYELRGN